MNFISNEGLTPVAVEKIKIMGAVFGATSKTALPIQPILPDFLVNGPNWQSCLAGSSKTALRILIFSIVLGAKYSFYVKAIATYASQCFGYNNSVLAVVHYKNL